MGLDNVDLRMMAVVSPTLKFPHTSLSLNPWTPIEPAEVGKKSIYFFSPFLSATDKDSRKFLVLNWLTFHAVAIILCLNL